MYRSNEPLEPFDRVCDEMDLNEDARGDLLRRFLLESFDEYPELERQFNAHVRRFVREHCGDYGPPRATPSDETDDVAMDVLHAIEEIELEISGEARVDEDDNWLQGV